MKVHPVQARKHQRSVSSKTCQLLLWQHWKHANSMHLAKSHTLRERTPDCLRFSFIWYISFKSSILRKKEIGCLRSSFDFSNILKGIMSQNSARICHQDFVQKLSIASLVFFFFLWKVQTLRPHNIPQPGTGEPFYPSLCSATASLSPAK